MAETIVLYPCPGMGHLFSMIELGKLILKHQPDFSVVILISNMPFGIGGSPAAYVSQVASTLPSITFRQLPDVTLLPGTSLEVHLLFSEVPRLSIPNVREAILSISKTSRIKAFIIDFFCHTSLQVSNSLNIPSYIFYTSPASALCFFLRIPVFHEAITQNLKDVDTLLQVPGTPALHPLDLPDSMFIRGSQGYNDLLAISISMAKSSGILLNTFQMMEPRAIKSLSDGVCVPKGSNSPPIYPIGPLINTGGGGGGGERPGCLKWLDEQPEKSVVFLCFGSMGAFKVEQLREMAVALERSGQRFLWVVRSPPAENGGQNKEEPDLDLLLPEGFLERTKGRGLVVKSWAPQLAVLGHPSVGGFVSHCGWNSSLEAIWSGVPMVAWPLYAEQRMNKRYLVEEYKVALPVEISPEGIVTAVELEKRVREVMKSESGTAIREQVAAFKDGAKAALEQGGSSYITIVELLTSWKGT